MSSLSMWACPSCKEEIEDTFGRCWNCGTDPLGNKDAEFEAADKIEAVRSPSVASASLAKTKELGIFTVGIGILFGAVVFYVNQFSRAPLSGSQLLLPLTIPAILIVAGILTLLVRTKPIIILTASLVVVGFVVDFVLAINPVKALITGAVLYLVLKTAKLALAEVDHPSQAVETKD